jgi:ribosomal protein L16/L10AE
MTEKWTPERIKELIQTRDVMVTRCVVQLYKQQTRDEQDSGITKYHNNRGFTGAEAEFGTSLAVQINAGKSLSPKQIAAARKVCLRHIVQLTKIANGEL